MKPVSDHDTRPDSPAKPPLAILIPQVVSMALIWVFVIGIAAWIVNLIALSIELNDAPGATVVISLIAIPIFVTLAGILTYVFIGLQKEERRLMREARTE